MPKLQSIAQEAHQRYGSRKPRAGQFQQIRPGKLGRSKRPDGDEVLPLQIFYRRMIGSIAGLLFNALRGAGEFMAKRPS